MTEVDNGAQGRRRAANAGRVGSRQHIGAQGESLAVAELERQGMMIVARNWRCRLGEIDIVALDPGPAEPTLVFCEVKCRTGLGFGAPLESITHAKLRRLRQLTAQFLADEHASPARIRMDAVGVVLIPGRVPELTHVRGIG